MKEYEDEEKGLEDIGSTCILTLVQRPYSRDGTEFRLS